MVKSDTSILVQGKDSSNISVVSEKGTAPRVEMRKKLPIPPPFVVTSQSYTPEYPWIGQPRPPPKTWSWKSAARIALYVVLLTTALGLVMYSAHRLIRWNKKAPSPQADGLIHAPGQQEELIRVDQLAGQVDIPIVFAQLIPVAPEIPMRFQPGELLRAQMLRRQEDGALPLSVPIPVPQEEPSVPTVGDLMRAQLLRGQEDQAGGVIAQVIRVSVSLSREEGPLPQQDRDEPQQQAMDISLSISTAPRDEGDLHSQSDSDKAVNEKPADVGEVTPGVADTDKPLLRSAGLTGEMAEVADGPPRDASAVKPDGNLLASAGLISEAVEARSDQSPASGGHDEQFLRSAAKTSEMAEALTPLRLNDVNDQRDKNLLRSASMSGEEAEVSRSSGPDRGNYDGNLLRSAAMTSEMAEAETLRGQRRVDLDKSALRSAALTSEIVEAMHINNSKEKSQKKILPAPVLRKNSHLSNIRLKQSLKPTNEDAAEVTTVQKQEDAQTQTPEDVEDSPAQQSNEVETEANAIKLSKAKRILARLMNLIQRQRALAIRLSALRKRAQEHDRELAKKDLDPQQKAMAVQEKMRIQSELSGIATTFWKQVAEIRGLRREAAEAGIQGTMQADSKHLSPAEEERLVTPAAEVESQTQDVQPVEVQPQEDQPHSKIRDERHENRNMNPLQSAGLTSEVVEAMNIRDRKNALRNSKIPHASEETAASPGRFLIGHGSNLIKSTKLTHEMAEAVHSEPSNLREKKDFSIAEKAQEEVAVSPMTAIETSRQKLQGAQTLEEQANVVAAEVDPIKFAKAQKLMTRLRDLNRRQRNLMKRVAALRMRAQELQQQVQQVHGEQELDPQQRTAEAMTRARRLIRVQRELAGLASVFRDQLAELRTIKKESYEAGLIGTTKGEQVPEQEMMQRVNPTAPVQVQPQDFQNKLLTIQPQEARHPVLIGQPQKIRPQMLIGQPQEIRPQMLTGQPQEIRFQVLADQPQDIQPRALIDQPQRFDSQEPIEQPQGVQPQVLIGQPQKVSPQLVFDQSQEVHSQEVVDEPGAPQQQQPQHLKVQLPLMMHVLKQRQLQRDAWQQEQRALAFLQLMDLYRKHGRLEQQAGQERQQHQQALQRIQQLAAGKPHAPNADSLELLSDALESPIAMSQSSPHTDPHHTQAAIRVR